MGITNLLFIPTYVPILVFVLLFILTMVYGALAGWKRTAYWGGSAMVWLFVGWIIYACAKNAIADLIINKIGSKFGDFDVHSVMRYAITSALSIFFYIIIILLGTLLVSV
ncbi:MAG: hypothetical protein LBM72_01975, partial [Mycoplasmataceae bacterium]|nr:hypothetical protein [Mycoplasmataceae bacterium]